MGGRDRKVLCVCVCVCGLEVHGGLGARVDGRLVGRGGWGMEDGRWRRVGVCISR